MTRARVKKFWEHFVQRLNSRQTSALCWFSVQTLPSFLWLTSLHQLSFEADFSRIGVPPERKLTEKNLGNQYFATKVFELKRDFCSRVLNKSRNVDEHAAVFSFILESAISAATWGGQHPTSRDHGDWQAGIKYSFPTAVAFKSECFSSQRNSRLAHTWFRFIA
ncbi:hypothetical protein ISCGN_007601 [Ixodes scapularis]